MASIIRIRHIANKTNQISDCTLFITRVVWCYISSLYYLFVDDYPSQDNLLSFKSRNAINKK